MDCSLVVTLIEVERALLAMQDINSFINSPDNTYVDAEGKTRYTLRGLR
jgi:hypothetical protein